MPFEYPDHNVKATAIFIKTAQGRRAYSGLVRLNHPDGTSEIRLTSSIDNTMEFDDIELLESDIDENDTELGLIHYEMPYYLGSPNE